VRSKSYFTAATPVPRATRRLTACRPSPDVRCALVTLRIVLPTPRCAIPSLAHGALPSQPQALRVAAARNRLDVPGFGYRPCAGMYAEVITHGVIQAGTPVTFVPG